MLNREPVRYLINGVIATLVNYGVLNFNVIVLNMESVGIASFIAAIFGTITSFLGSRYFVYRKHRNTAVSQIIRFIFLYGFLAILSGLILYVWSDIYSLDYRVGFIISIFVQLLFSYFGNKMLVFKSEN
jgi:putative flippase GtrA